MVLSVHISLSYYYVLCSYLREQTSIIMAYGSTLGLQPGFDDLGMANMELEKVRAMIQDTRNSMAVFSDQIGFEGWSKAVKTCMNFRWNKDKGKRTKEE